MHGYLSAHIICSERQTVFREHSLRKTASFEEQINVQGQISKHIFAPNRGYCVHYSSNLFRNIPQFWSCDVLRPITRERKCLMDYNECYYGLQYFNNLFNLEFCIGFSLYQLVSSIYTSSMLYPLSSTSYSLHSMCYAV